MTKAMTKIIKIVLLLILIPINTQASDWNIYIFGVNLNRITSRDMPLMIVGGAISMAVHEYGHYIAGELTGGDSEFATINSVHIEYNNNYSDNDRAIVAVAGFAAQSLVGSLLTVIPRTRHSDFTIGFNATSAFNGYWYGITGGRDKNTSDVEHLNELGYNGEAIAIGLGTYSGVLTHINLEE